MPWNAPVFFVVTTRIRTHQNARSHFVPSSAAPTFWHARDRVVVLALNKSSTVLAKGLAAVLNEPPPLLPHHMTSHDLAHTATPKRLPFHARVPLPARCAARGSPDKDGVALAEAALSAIITKLRK